MLAPFAFAPLWLRWRLLLGAPLVAELVFARPWAYPIARIGTHWTASCVAAAALAAAYAVAKRPRLATPMVVCAALCALALNDTVLKPGRWPFVVDRTAYARAAALRATERTVVVPPPRRRRVRRRGREPARVLARYDPHETGYCPAYDKNARAFFASLGVGAWPPDITLCGGVPVTRRSAPGSAPPTLRAGPPIRPRNNIVGPAR